MLPPDVTTPYATDTLLRYTIILMMLHNMNDRTITESEHGDRLMSHPETRVDEMITGARTLILPRQYDVTPRALYAATLPMPLRH